MTPSYKQSLPSDFKAIIDLLEENNLPTTDISDGQQIFFTATTENTVIGCIAVEVYESIGLIRSFAVSKNHQGKNIGKELYSLALKYSSDNGLQKLYLLTTTAEGYFKKLGWSQLERNSMPLTIRNSSEFSSVCPTSAICMEFSLLPYHADQLFTDGFNCAQSVFYPFAVRNGIAPDHVLKLSTGFGAGMVYRGETCGAVTGAMMAIGLKNGRSKASDYDSKDKTYMLINELYKKFKAKHGSILCKELLRLENTNAENWAKASKEGLFDTLCPNFVIDAAIIAEELINK